MWAALCRSYAQKEVSSRLAEVPSSDLEVACAVAGASHRLLDRGSMRDQHRYTKCLCARSQARNPDIGREVRALCGGWRQAPGTESGSTVISFAQKTFAGGVLTSKLHVIELGAQPGASRAD